MSQVDIGRIRNRAREISKSLLGAQFRAEVAAFVGYGESPFWARGMAQALEIPENKVAAELVRFADAGLLTALPGEAWDRRRLYEPNRASGHYWANAQGLIRQAAEEEGLRVGVDAESAWSAYREDVSRRSSGAAPWEGR